MINISSHVTKQYHGTSCGYISKFPATISSYLFGSPPGMFRFRKTLAPYNENSTYLKNAGCFFHAWILQVTLTVVLLIPLSLTRASMYLDSRDWIGLPKNISVKDHQNIKRNCFRCIYFSDSDHRPQHKQEDDKCPVVYPQVHRRQPRESGWSSLHLLSLH